MLKKIIFLALILGIKNLAAQTITIEFPAFAGKTYDFIIFQNVFIILLPL